LGDGEKQISLLNLKNFVLESWIHKYLGPLLGAVHQLVHLEPFVSAPEDELNNASMKHMF
jgi:hypothetical protein